MRASIGIERAVDLEHEVAQHPRLGQVRKHLTEPASFSAVEIFGAGHEQIAMLPDEVGLILLGLLLTAAGSLLGSAGSTPTPLASSLGGEFATHPSQGIEDVGIDVLEDVKDAQLMASLGPKVCQELRVEVGTVGHDHPR